MCRYGGLVTQHELEGLKSVFPWIVTICTRRPVYVPWGLMLHQRNLPAVRNRCAELNISAALWVWAKSVIHPGTEFLIVIQWCFWVPEKPWKVDSFDQSEAYVMIVKFCHLPQTQPRRHFTFWNPDFGKLGSKCLNLCWYFRSCFWTSCHCQTTFAYGAQSHQIMPAYLSNWE